MVLLGPRCTAQGHELGDGDLERDAGIRQQVRILDDLRMAAQVTDPRIVGATGQLQIAAASEFIAVARLGVAQLLR